MIKKVFFLLFVLVLFSGCASKVLVDGEPVSVSDEVLCVKDSDCACGVHIETGDCFYGNKDFVDDLGIRVAPAGALLENLI